MTPIDDARTLFLHATVQLGCADAVSHARGEHRLSPADKNKYEAAVTALAGVEGPLARGEVLHAAIGGMWGAPSWADMQGPERAAYVSLAGASDTIDGTVPLPNGRPGVDTPAARQAWDEATKDHQQRKSRRKAGRSNA